MSSIRNTIIANLEDAIDDVRLSTSYPITVSKVVSFEQNILTTERKDTPLIMLAPRDETVQVVDDTHVRKVLNIDIYGVVNSQRADKLHEDLGHISAFIQQFADSVTEASLGTAVLSFRLTENATAMHEAQTMMIGAVRFTAEIVYYATLGSY